MKLLLLVCAIINFTSASPARRTVGGRVVNPRDVQWLVKVDVGEIFRCDSVYLNNKHVATLASCFPEFNGEIPKRTVLLYEAYYKFDANWAAANIYKHELYMPGVPEYDIAILALNKAAPEYLIGKALALPEVNEGFPSGVLVATVAGSQVRVRFGLIQDVIMND